MAVLAGGLLISRSLHAEQGCPNGMYPGGMQPNGPICIPAPGGGSSEAQVTERWEDRWGAIATDAKNGYMGIAVDQQSEYLAKATALTQCRDVGGTECVVAISYANACVVLATGDGSFLIRAAPTLAEATSAAFQECENSGMVCKIPYQACSLSERVR